MRCNQRPAPPIRRSSRSSDHPPRRRVPQRAHARACTAAAPACQPRPGMQRMGEAWRPARSPCGRTRRAPPHAGRERELTDFLGAETRLRAEIARAWPAAVEAVVDAPVQEASDDAAAGDERHRRERHGCIERAECERRVQDDEKRPRDAQHHVRRTSIALSRRRATAATACAADRGTAAASRHRRRGPPIPEIGPRREATRRASNERSARRRPAPEQPVCCRRFVDAANRRTFGGPGGVRRCAARDRRRGAPFRHCSCGSILLLASNRTASSAKLRGIGFPLHSSPSVPNCGATIEALRRVRPRFSPTALRAAARRDPRGVRRAPAPARSRDRTCLDAAVRRS